MDTITTTLDGAPAAAEPLFSCDFDDDFGLYPLSKMVAGNQDRPELCEWLRSAKPGERHDDCVRVR